MASAKIELLFWGECWLVSSMGSLLGKNELDLASQRTFELRADELWNPIELCFSFMFSCSYLMSISSDISDKMALPTSPVSESAATVT